MDSKIISSVLSLALEDYIDAQLLIWQNRLLNGGHLSALAVEKLLKGLILAFDMQPKYVQLDKVDILINQASKTIPNIQNYINVDFLHYLGRIFSIRYFPHMLAFMRKQSKETFSETMAVTNLLLQMQSFEDEFRNFPPDQAFPVEKALEFYNFMVPFVAAINEMARKIKALKENFDKEFKARGIDIQNNEMQSS